MNILPLGSQVVVEMLRKSERVEGGIYLPDDVDDFQREGKVVALGTGGLRDDGSLIPFNVKVGDKVILPKYGDTKIIVNKREYSVIRESDIVCVVR